MAERDLRREVRSFLAEQRDAGAYEPTVDSWMVGFNPPFSRALGERGWIGMTWPDEYGGAGLSALERFAVIEELLAAGAPVAAHWFADRQIGPGLLRYGTDEQRARFLPEIAAGTCYFAIGLSEPDAGSDLAAIRTRAERVDGGFRVTGTKVWTSGAQLSHYLMTLCRTGGSRHEGLSQLIIALDAPGVTIRPIRDMTGAAHFNEVHLQDVFVSSELLVGAEGQGWAQVTSELAFERSGPERYMSTYPLLSEFSRLVCDAPPDDAALSALGSIFADFWSVRLMSVGVAADLDSGRAPGGAAALVKEVGTRLEQQWVESIRLNAHRVERSPVFDDRLRQACDRAPTFTVRGGTNEILRSIIGKDLVS